MEVEIASGGEHLIEKQVPALARCTPTVPAGNVFTRWGLAVSEKQIPQLVANIEKGHRKWSCWSRVSCAQGRRATRLRYAPT